LQLSILLLLTLVLSPTASTGAADDDEPPKLLGPCTVKQLETEPFAEWYRSGYKDYTPKSEILEELRAVDTAGIDITVFLGTWCGDSRREVPRILKVLDEMGFPQENLALVGVDWVDEAHKQSPGGEERGLEIYRVPTFIVERGGREISRFVEYPVLSVERDLLAILSDEKYEPSYASYPVVRRWLDDGLLADPNISPRGLANEVRHIADALLHAGEPEQARAATERALRLNDDPERIEILVELIERMPEKAERADD
jgi:hypothetical protein